MAEIKDVVFRSSLKGYNKEDVNTYIIRMSEEFTLKEDSLRERAERSEKELSELEGNIKLLKSNEEDNAARLSDALKEIEELRKENQALFENKNTYDGDEIAEKDKKLSEQEAVIARQFEEIDKMREELQKLKCEKEAAEDKADQYEELSRKAQLYDKTSANIGDAIISANKTAEEIISSAREEARIIVEKAEKELSEKRKALEDSSARVFGSIFSKLNAAALENRKEVATASAYASQIFERSLSEIKARNENVSSKLKSYEENLWKSIRDDLDSINNTEKNDRQKQPTKRASADQAKRQKR
ncbi:MAG: hypothetical protein U0M06_12990 [Clostridia bacterium]|nr:hypothetical protein [Clostridia bacterium]